MRYFLLLIRFIYKGILICTKGGMENEAYFQKHKDVYT